MCINVCISLLCCFLSYLILVVILHMTITVQHKRVCGRFSDVAGNTVLTHHLGDYPAVFTYRLHMPDLKIVCLQTTCNYLTLDFQIRAVPLRTHKCFKFQKTNSEILCVPGLSGKGFTTSTSTSRTQIDFPLPSPAQRTHVSLGFCWIWTRPAD